MTPQDAAVAMAGVSMRRADNTILRDIDWVVPSGAHTAIIGANGSGKTSLLKLVTAYEWATNGTIHVLGERLGHVNVRALRKRIGWATAHLAVRIPRGETALSIALSGLEASIGAYREFSAADSDQALQALALVNAAHLAGRTFETLSQGERQRTLIARALAPNPEILILDEPCAGLDPAARDHLLGDLGWLAESPEAPTIFMVTHHIEEIAPWIARVLVLKDGRRLAWGAPADVLTSTCLGEAFAWPCTVHYSGRHFSLRPAPRARDA